MAATSHTITSTAATLTIPGGSPIGAKILQIAGPVVRFSTGGTTVPPTSNFEMLAVGQLLGEVLGQPGVLHGIPGARILGDVGDLSAKVSSLGLLRTTNVVGPVILGELKAANNTVSFNPGHGMQSWAVQLSLAGTAPASLNILIEYSLDGIAYFQEGAAIGVAAFSNPVIIRQVINTFAAFVRVRYNAGTFTSQVITVTAVGA